MARVVTVPATPSAVVGVDLRGNGRAQQLAHVGAAGRQLLGRRRVSVQEPLGQADAAEVEARVEGDALGPAQDQLRGAAADVDDERGVGNRAARGDAAEGQERLLVAGEKPRREAVAPLQLTEERLAVLRVAYRAGRQREGSLGTELVCGAPVVDENVSDASDGRGQQLAAASPRLLRAA